MKRSSVHTVTALAIALSSSGAAVTTAQAADAAAAKPLAGKALRGQYLVNTSGCHDCHTPWKLGDKGPEPDMSRSLSGHPQALVMPPAPQLPAGPWTGAMSATNTAWAGPWGVSFTANLTPDRETGLGDWTQRDFVQTIRTGRHMGRGRAVLPPMPIPAYKNFNDADLAAIYAYLRTIPAVSNRVPEPLPPAPVVQAQK
jgi:hypothetical protein